MKKKILDVIGMLIISTAIAVWSLIIGANEKGLRTVPISIFLFISLVYLIVRKVLLKQKIVIKNKLDAFVLAFMCITLLPLIFKTYCSLQGTVEFIIKYFYVYGMYLVVRNTVDSKRKVNVIINITLVSSLIIAIIGIDVQYFNKSYWLLDRLNLKYTPCEKLISSFGYGNSVAIYFAFCIFLAISQIQNAKKIFVKLIYMPYIILSLYVIFLTVCRAVYVLLAGAVLVYFVFYYFKALKNKFLNTKNKKIILILAITCVFIIVLGILFAFFVGLKVSKPYAFRDRYYIKFLNHKFKPGQEYKIELEAEIMNVSENPDSILQVSIVEMNEYFNRYTLSTNIMNIDDKKISLTVTPTEDVYQIGISIVNNYGEIVSLQKCYIDGEECPLNYKYLPYKVGDSLSRLFGKDRSLTERMMLWKDCIKITKLSPIIGHGGNTWKMMSESVQEYPYAMKETHSYLFELLISYGILGTLLFSILIIAFNIKMFKEFFKEQKENTENSKKSFFKLAIFFGLDLIILHSYCFDFNLSFLVLLQNVFIYLAILMYEDEEIKGFRIIDYFIIAVLICVFGVLVATNYARYYLGNSKLKKDLGFYLPSWSYQYINLCINNEVDVKYTLAETQKLMVRQPYFMQGGMYELYWNLLLNHLSELTEPEVADYVTFINERYRKVRFFSPMYIDTILPRVKIMKNAYRVLKAQNYKNEKLIEQINELNQIMKDEYKVNKVNIENNKRNGHTENYTKAILENYEELLRID